MYVRWQTYRSQRRNERLRAMLVECVRMDGKPRQRHIAFLGSIASDSLGHPRPGFWYAVTAKLKRLGDRIRPEDYERIMVSIAAKVGGRALSEAELEQFELEREQILRSARTCLAPYRRAPRPPRPAAA